MSAFTDAELAYLRSQPLMRFATASPSGKPDVAPVIFEIDGDDIVTAGFDITHTARYRNIQRNPQATLVIDDLSSVDPWSPRGVKIIGATAHYATSGGWVGGWRVCCPIRTLAPPEYPPPTPAPAHPPPDLDCGPIIDQDVRRVTHRDSVQDMVRKARSRVCARVRACVVGPSAHQPPHPPTPHPPTHEQGRDLERLVLARAVRWHVEDRVIVHNNKTVVFED